MHSNKYEAEISKICEKKFFSEILGFEIFRDFETKLPLAENPGTLVQSIEPHRILAPTRDLRIHSPETTILLLHTIIVEMNYCKHCTINISESACCIANVLIFH